MNSQRILTGTAWIASAGIAYFAGTWWAGEDSRPAVAAAAEPHRAPSMQAAPPVAQTGSLADGGGQAADLPALIAQAQVALGGGAQFPHMLQAFGPWLKISQEQIPAALAEVNRTVRGKKQRLIFYSVLLGRWAEKDPAAALAYADAHLGLPADRDSDLRVSILGNWARRDPSAAFRWLDTLPKQANTERRFMLRAVFSGMTETDPDFAFTQLGKMDEDTFAEACPGALQSITSSAAARRLLERVSAWPANRQRFFRREFGEAWARVDIHSAVDWIRSLPVEQRGDLMSGLGSALMNQNPQIGAELWVENPGSMSRSSVYAEAATNWARTDPEAVEAWLAKQPEGTDLDEAWGRFAVVMSRREPQQAFAWALNVQKKEKRNGYLAEVYSSWSRQDALAAEAALQRAGISREDLQGSDTNFQERIFYY